MGDRERSKWEITNSVEKEKGGGESQTDAVEKAITEREIAMPKLTKSELGVIGNIQVKNAENQWDCCSFFLRLRDWHSRRGLK